MDITDADMDSDFGYTTNHPDIVAHAKRCYAEYPTIVNNIPKEKNIYDKSIENYALIDNNLAKSQLDIGESSNLAQIAQTYACNFSDQKYQDYTCILSVVAQISIDNCKRRYDIDTTDEIRRIRNDMNIKEHGYPQFWQLIRPDFNKSRINEHLRCPMNYLCDLDLSKYRSDDDTLPMSRFFISYKNNNRVQSRKVEELIEKYSLKITNSLSDDPDDDGKSFLLRSDFDDLVSEIQNTTISSNYLGMFSWLIDRAFRITPDLKKMGHKVQSQINRNRALLIRVLYLVNKKALLKCFGKH